MERSSTVRALRALLSEPSSDTSVTTQFAAMRTEMSISQLFHTNETSENFCQCLDAVVVRDFGGDRRIPAGHPWFEVRPLSTNIDYFTERSVRETHVLKLDHHDAFDTTAVSVSRGIALTQSHRDDARASVTNRMIRVYVCYFVSV